jgi:hypothetical protein
MINRILLAGLLGGLALFLWEFVAHDVITPLGSAGLSRLPAEDATRATLKQQIPNSGLYYFPAPADMSNKDQVNKAMEDARTGPAGLMMIEPGGSQVGMGRQLAIQFVVDAATMMLAAWLVSLLPPVAFRTRLLFVLALALLPGLRAQIPMWNWYRFPKAFTAAAIGIDLAGFFIAGFIIAKLVQSRARTMAAAS